MDSLQLFLFSFGAVIVLLCWLRGDKRRADTWDEITFGVGLSALVLAFMLEAV